MRYAYKKYAFIGIALLILCGIVFFIIKSPFTSEEVPNDDEAISKPLDLSTIDLQESPGAIMAIGNEGVIVNGNIYASVNNKAVDRPFMKNGVSYYPLEVIAELYHAEIEKLPFNIFVITNRFKEKTFTCTSYSIAIYNNTEIELDGTPLIKDGVLYLSAKDIANIIGVNYTYDYNKGILKLNSNEITDSDYSLIQNSFETLEYEDFDIDRLNLISEHLKLDIETVMEYARGGHLFSSDGEGRLTQILLRDDFTLESIPMNKMLVYTPDEYFVEGINGDHEHLYALVDGKLINTDATPKIKEKNNSLSAKIQFHNTKYLKDVFNLPLEEQLEQELKDIDSFAFNDGFIYRYGESSNELINIKKTLINKTNKKIPLTDKYDFYTFDAVARFQQSNNISITGMLDDTTLALLGDNTSDIDENVIDNESITEIKWNEFIESCEIGDILLFRKTIGTVYGLNNHAVLIVDVLPEGKLQLLHARGVQYGVGFEDEMDFLSFDMLENDEYWQKTDMITVYELPDLRDDERIKLVEAACQRYREYAFGYMNILGKKEITCGELLRDAYKDAGYDIYDKKLFLQDLERLKDGISLEDIIFLPDTIMLSDIMKIKAVWQRS